MLKLGVIGVGNIGKAHIRSVQQEIADAQVVKAAVSTLRESTLSWLKGQGVNDVTTDYREILQDPDIDAVLICTPTATHTEISTAALYAGKHVFCEKPISVDASGIPVVSRAIQETGRKFQIGFMKRFDHNHGTLVERSGSGSLGRLQLARITSRDPAPPPMEYLRHSGGIFLDMMIHDIDLSRCLLHSEAVEVFATGDALTSEEFRRVGDVDTAVACIRMESGAMAIIENARSCAYGYDQRVEVFGTKGMIQTANDMANATTVATAEGYTRPLPIGFYQDRYANAYTAELRAFIRSIRENLPVQVGIRDAYSDYVIALAATKAMQEHRIVTVSEIEEELQITL